MRRARRVRLPSRSQCTRSTRYSAVLAVEHGQDRLIESALRRLVLVAQAFGSECGCAPRFLVGHALGLVVSLVELAVSVRAVAVTTTRVTLSPR
eukprot:6212255-Pleurochrysis_carterae.AAC.1